MKPIYALLLALAASQAAAADITVSAAASLKDAFAEIAQTYQHHYPQAKVRLNTAGSGALLQQAAQGAPVDVLAFADETTMNQAQQKKLIDAATRKTFALNSLVLAAPADSRLRVNKLSDLGGSAFGRIAVSNPKSVPVGRYTEAALKQAGVWQMVRPKVISTQNVRQSLDYIARGEVDAGFVYNTDAALMKGKVKVLRQVTTVEPVSYPIAVAASSAQSAEAKRFVRYVLSAQGQKVLKKYGFKKP